MFLITCPFGLSSMLGNELKLFGYKGYNSFPTGTFCDGDIQTMYSINIKSRIANKVYLSLGEKRVTSFDELFDFVNSLPFKKYIQDGQKINVTTTSKNSKLTSTPSIQSISHKAIIKKTSHREDEGRGDLKIASSLHYSQGQQSDFEVFIFIQDDLCQFFVNTSGNSLHQRGYRTQTGDAPIKENVAAGLVLLSGRKFKEKLYDPFCGSGTILIEAAMIAKNIAPGLNRSFAFQNFPDYDKSLFNQIKDECNSKIFKDRKYQIFGSDIDESIIQMAKQNAKNAGVDDTIEFSQGDIFELNDISGRCVTNPPYGKRLQDFDLNKIHSHLNKLFSVNDLRGGIITLYEGFQNIVEKIYRNTKTIFNGQEQCTFWTRK